MSRIDFLPRSVTGTAPLTTTPSGDVTVTGTLDAQSITINGQSLTANAPPPGSNKQIAFNDNGEFGASSLLTFDKSSGQLSCTSLNGSSSVSAPSVSATDVTASSQISASSVSASSSIACDGSYSLLGDTLATATRVYIPQQLSYVTSSRYTLSFTTAALFTFGGSSSPDWHRRGFLILSIARADSQNMAYASGLHQPGQTPRLTVGGTSPSITTLTTGGLAAVRFGSMNASYEYVCSFWLLSY